MTFSTSRRRFLRIAPFVAAAVLLGAASGCARPLKDQLAGKWRQTNGRWFELCDPYRGRMF